MILFLIQLHLFWSLLVHLRQHSHKKSTAAMNSSVFHVVRTVVSTFSSAWLVDVSTFRAMMVRFSTRIVFLAVRVTQTLANSSSHKFPTMHARTSSWECRHIPIPMTVSTSSSAWTTISFDSVAMRATFSTVTTPWDAFPEIRRLAARRPQFLLSFSWRIFWRCK